MGCEENKPLVDEVLRFFSDGSLAWNRSGTLPERTRVVSDIPSTGAMAGKNGLPQWEWAKGDSQQGYDEVCDSYSSSASRELKRRRNRPTGLKEYVGDAVFKGQWAHGIGAVLTEDLYPLSGWIIGDVYEIALTRAAFGFRKDIPRHSDNLFERIFDVYKSGAMPVGWDGVYPNSVILLVWHPPVVRNVTREENERRFTEWQAARDRTLMTLAADLRARNFQIRRGDNDLNLRTRFE